MSKTDEERWLEGEEESACPACKVSYSKHAGINGTCKQLQGSIALVEKLKEVTKELVNSNTALHELMKYATSAERNNSAKWMRGFEEKTNEVLEIIGDEDRVELKGGRLVVCRQRPGAGGS